MAYGITYGAHWWGLPGESGAVIACAIEKVQHATRVGPEDDTDTAQHRGTMKSREEAPRGPVTFLVLFVATPRMYRQHARNKLQSSLCLPDEQAV
eukprot:scaffold36376_cov27-Tisochrysis_lutea.AAC.3